MSSEAAPGKKTVAGERGLACPDCKKEEYARDGRHHGKHEKRQGHGCPACGRRFRDSPGLGCRRAPRPCITPALMLCGTGTAAANIRLAPRHPGVGVHVGTITRILDHYSKTVGEYARTARPPCAGDRRGCDEKRRKVRGRESHVAAVTGPAARFVPARGMSPARERYGAVPPLRAAGNAAGGIPRLSVTDGPGRHRTAFKRAFRTPRGPMSIRIRDTRIRSPVRDTNRQGRPGGGLAGRFRYARGTSKGESLIFRTAILHYSYTGPHGGMAHGTPAGAAGTGMRGADGRPAPIRNAASAARGAADARRHGTVWIFAPTYTPSGRGLAKNRPKTNCGDPRIPGLGRIAVRIWDI